MVRCRDLHRFCLPRLYLVTEKRVLWWFAAGICTTSAFPDRTW